MLRISNARGNRIRDEPLSMIQGSSRMLVSCDVKVGHSPDYLFDSPYAFVLESGAATMTMETV